MKSNSQINMPANGPPNRSFHARQQTQNNTLYITNFNRQLTRKNFQQLFQPFGKTNQICIFNSFKIAAPYAFVQYDDLRDAVTAKNQLDNKIISGMPLKIQYKRPRSTNPEVKNRFIEGYQYSTDHRRQPSYNQYVTPQIYKTSLKQAERNDLNQNNKPRHQQTLKNILTAAPQKSSNQNMSTNQSSLKTSNIVNSRAAITKQDIKDPKQWSKLGQNAVISDKVQKLAQSRDLNDPKIQRQYSKNVTPLQNQFSQKQTLKKEQQSTNTIQIFMGSQKKKNNQSDNANYTKANFDRQKKRIQKNQKYREHSQSQLSSNRKSSQKSHSNYDRHRRDSKKKNSQQWHYQKKRYAQKQDYGQRSRQKHHKPRYYTQRNYERNFESPTKQKSHHFNQQRDYEKKQAYLNSQNESESYRHSPRWKYFQDKHVRSSKGYGRYDPTYQDIPPRKPYENPQNYHISNNVFQQSAYQILQPKLWELKSHISRIYGILQGLSNRIAGMQKTVQQISIPKTRNARQI